MRRVQVQEKVRNQPGCASLRRARSYLLKPSKNPFILKVRPRPSRAATILQEESQAVEEYPRGPDPEEQAFEAKQSSFLRRYRVDPSARGRFMDSSLECRREVMEGFRPKNGGHRDDDYSSRLSAFVRLVRARRGEGEFVAAPRVVPPRNRSRSRGGGVINPRPTSRTIQPEPTPVENTGRSSRRTRIRHRGRARKPHSPSPTPSDR